MRDWTTALNCHGQVDAILLDLSKSFNKVSHTKLLYKLQNYGICGKTHSWTAGFLANRPQFVSVNACHSSSIPVTSGVPHRGSVLGPALFQLFINDIISQTNSQIRLFADNTIVYRTINNYYHHHILKNDLSKLSSWAKDWQMDFNVSK